MIVTPPVSGLWRGLTERVTLSRQDACGVRHKGQTGDVEPFWAVLFFDEDTVAGHATQDGQYLTLSGWWGPSRHLLPVVSDLAETELWQSGDMGLQLRIRAGGQDEVCFAWLQGDRISGYRRRDGG